MTEALSAARMARVRWTGSISALKAEIQMLNAGADAAPQAAKGVSADDATVESTREIGRLQGQVNALQTQAKDAIEREKILKTKVLEAEEALRKEQKSSVEVRQKNVELEAKLQEAQQQTQESAAAPQQTMQEGKEEVVVAGGPNGAK